MAEAGWMGSEFLETAPGLPIWVPAFAGMSEEIGGGQDG